MTRVSLESLQTEPCSTPTKKRACATETNAALLSGMPRYALYSINSLEFASVLSPGISPQGRRNKDNKREWREMGRLDVSIGEAFFPCNLSRNSRLSRLIAGLFTRDNSVNWKQSTQKGDKKGGRMHRLSKQRREIEFASTELIS